MYSKVQNFNKGQEVQNVMDVMLAKLLKTLNFSKVQTQKESIIFVKKSIADQVSSFI